MKILVINAGSSSLKYQLIDMDTEQMIAKGNCERIGQEGSFIGHKTADGRAFTKEIPMPDHAKAFLAVSDALLSDEFGNARVLPEAYNNLKVLKDEKVCDIIYPLKNQSRHLRVKCSRDGELSGRRKRPARPLRCICRIPL